MEIMVVRVSMDHPIMSISQAETEFQAQFSVNVFEYDT